MPDKHSIIKGAILGVFGFLVALGGYAANYFFGWPFLFMIIIAIFLLHPAKWSLKSFIANSVVIVVLAVGLTAIGHGIIMFQKWQICSKLNPLIMEMEKYKKTQGTYPLNLEGIPKPTSLRILVVKEDEKSSIFDLNNNDAIVYLSEHEYSIYVPVTKVLIFSFTRFYAYIYSSANSKWHLDRIIWTWIGLSRKVL
jgi:hypothetical protein